MVLQQQCDSATLIKLGRHGCNPASSITAAAAAEAAASRKEVKYSDLPASFAFQPIAVETLGPINESAVDFLGELGRRISSKFQQAYYHLCNSRCTMYIIIIIVCNFQVKNTNALQLTIGEKAVDIRKIQLNGNKIKWKLRWQSAALKFQFFILESDKVCY